jgi:hypothetical protein
MAPLNRDDEQKKKDFSTGGSLSPPQGSKLGIASSDRDPRKNQDRQGGEPAQPGEFISRLNDDPAEGSREAIDSLVKRTG